jgi:hypothetical protein
MPWIQWPECRGTGGRNAPEYALHRLDPEIQNVKEQMKNQLHAKT